MCGVFHRSMVDWRGGKLEDMCIILYMKVIQCSGIPYICGQLEVRGVNYDTKL